MRRCLCVVALVLSVGCQGLAYGASFTVAREVEALGETKLYLEKACERLHAAPLNDLDFVLSDVSFKQTRRFTRYSGDISGRMLGALDETAPILKANMDFIDKLIADFPDYQKVDGHFGAEQDLEKSVNQDRDMPILWGNGRLLLALAEYCLRHEDEQALAMAKKLGDYAISTRPYYGKEENFTKVGGSMASGFTTCYPSLIDGLVMLGKLTGEQKYYEEARYIGNLSFLDKEFDHHHSHGRLVTWRGLLDLNFFTQTDDFLPRIQEGAEKIYQTYILPTGGVTEVFDRHYARDEGCSEADWIRVTFFLWRATGDVKWLDRCEHAIENHLKATQFNNGSFGHWVYKPVQYRGQEYHAGRLLHWGSDSYWCCSMHCTQVLGDIAKWSAILKGAQLDLTFLAEAKCVFEEGENRLESSLIKDGPNKWHVSLKSLKECTKTIRFHVPAWASFIHINHEKYPAEAGWVSFERTWEGSIHFDVVFPPVLRFMAPYEDRPAKDEPARIFVGARLYCLSTPKLREAFLDDALVPKLLMAANATDGPHGFPVLVKGKEGKLQQAILEPMQERMEGKCFFLFDVERLSPQVYAQQAQQALPPVDPGFPLTLYFASDAAYTVYLNGEALFSGKGFHESPRITAYTRSADNVVAVKVSAKEGAPGVIGVVEANGKYVAVTSEEWDSQFLEGAPSKELLSATPETPQKAKELGAFGSEPWKHMPAHFADTGAQWIWPNGSVPEKKSATCLSRTSFSLR